VSRLTRVGSSALNSVHADPACRELQREGDAIQSAADFAHDGRICVAKFEGVNTQEEAARTDGPTRGSTFPQVAAFGAFRLRVTGVVACCQIGAACPQSMTFYSNTASKISMSTKGDSATNGPPTPTFDIRQSVGTRIPEKR
jgi:hypothetical protein